MAKKSNKNAKSESQDVIVLDLKTILNPLTVLLSSLFLGIILVVGFYSINETLKDIDGVRSDGGNEAVAGDDIEQEATGDTLQAGDSLSTTVDDDTPMAGSKDAKVAVVEYSDYACGYCGRHANETLDQILDNYVDDGKVAYYFKGFPIFTPLNASGAYCANQVGGSDKFLEYHKAMFNQDQVTGEEDQILEVANSVGIDANSFKDCLDSDIAQNISTEEFAEAQELGFGGTPAFIVGTLNDDGSIDGEFVSGAQPYSVFEETIERYL